MDDKRTMIIEIDSLFQKMAKDNNCQFKELLKENITPTQFIIMKLIYNTPDCKAADIAHMLDISPAAATSILDRLSNNGWVDRIRSEKDRRIVRLKLTEHGVRKLNDIDQRRIDLLTERFKKVTEEEIALIKEIFKKILAAGDTHKGLNL